MPRKKPKTFSPGFIFQKYSGGAAKGGGGGAPERPISIRGTQGTALYEEHNKKGHTHR